MATRFSTRESNAIKLAREASPTMSQRTLARQLHETGITADFGSPADILYGRSEQSIYGAIRVFDKNKAKTPVSTTRVGRFSRSAVSS